MSPATSKLQCDEPHGALVMEKIIEDQRSSFIGRLTQASYSKNGKRTDDIQLIYGRFDDNSKILDPIYAAFK
jgi:hypothetical protein